MAILGLGSEWQQELEWLTGTLSIGSSINGKVLELERFCIIQNLLQRASKQQEETLDSLSVSFSIKERLEGTGFALPSSRCYSDFFVQYWFRVKSFNQLSE